MCPIMYSKMLCLPGFWLSVRDLLKVQLDTHSMPGVRVLDALVVFLGYTETLSLLRFSRKFESRAALN